MRLVRSALFTTTLACMLFVAGCGGSSSSSPEFLLPQSSTSPSEGGTAELRGGAAKGILSGAEIDVFKRVSGSWVPVSKDATTTDENGQFSLSLKNVEGPVLVTLTTTPSTTMVCDAPMCDEDVAFGDVYTPPIFTLKSIIPDASTAETFAITPLTTLAAEWVMALPGSIEVNAASVGMALERVADLFDLSEAFYTDLPVDITDADAVAGKASVQAELLSAAFIVQGQQIPDSLQNHIDAFVALGGQLSLDEALIETSLNAIVRRSLEVADIGGNAIFGDGSKLDEVKASLNQVLNKWAVDGAPVTSATSTREFTPDQKARFEQSKTLFNQLDTYLNAAGVDKTATFIQKHREQLNWLYKDEAARADTTDLVVTVGKMGVTAFLASLMRSQYDLLLNMQFFQGAIPEACSTELYSDIMTTGTLRYCTNGELTFDGTIGNQTVAAIIAIPKIPVSDSMPMPLAMAFTLSPLPGHDMAFVDNPTARGELTATLNLTLNSANAGAITELGDLFLEDNLLATQLDIAVDLNGSLTRLSEAPVDHIVQTGEAFQVALKADLQADLSALDYTVSDEGIPTFTLAEDLPLVVASIDSGLFQTPRGDYLKDLAGDPFCEGRKTLGVTIADTSTAEACFAARLLELPEMRVTGEGSLVGAVDFANQFIAGFLGTDPLAVMLAKLDPSDVDLTATGKLLVRDEQLGDQLYRLTLNRNHATVEHTVTGDRVDIYLTSLNGGYLANGETWVGSFYLNWEHMGIRFSLADNDRTEKTYALGSLMGAFEPELVMLITDSLSQIGSELGITLGSDPAATF